MDDSDILAIDDDISSPSNERKPTNAEWVDDVFTASPPLRLIYLEAKTDHPLLFESRELATIVSFVEPLVEHFARDGLTREDCFDALTMQPQLLLRKPSQVIADIEKVFKHFDAEPPARAAYLLALTEHPALLRVPPSAMIASIETLNATQLPENGQPSITLPLGECEHTLPEDAARKHNAAIFAYQEQFAYPPSPVQQTPGTLIDRAVIQQVERAMARRSGRTASG
jgi:hypothetical protein